MRYIVIFYHNVEKNENVFLVQSEEKAMKNGWIFLEANKNVKPYGSKINSDSHFFVFPTLYEADFFAETMMKRCFDDAIKCGVYRDTSPVENDEEKEDT